LTPRKAMSDRRHTARTNRDAESLHPLPRTVLLLDAVVAMPTSAV
jgi:hypothetical protein